jgi:hypothetical protein
MRLYCVTYIQRDDEIGEHDTVEYFRTKQDALRAIRGLSADPAGCYVDELPGSKLCPRCPQCHPRAQFDNISLECIELPLRKQEIIEALNLSNHGQSAQNATLIEYFDDIGMSDD